MGPLSPHWKHGKYSRVLPQSLRASYEAALADPELVSLRGEVALADARLLEAVGALGERGGRAAWSELRALAADMLAAQKRVDYEGFVKGAVALAERLREADDVERAWMQVDNLVEQKRKLVESEARRAAIASEQFTLETATALVVALGESVRRNVIDGVPPAQARARVAADMRRLMSGNVLDIEPRSQRLLP